MHGLIDSNEAAVRLGIKRSTLYVYVSRGFLTSHREGRRSLFELEEIEQFANRARANRRPATEISSIATSITQILETGHSYRGHPAAELAVTASFEEVADLLWQAEPGQWEPLDISVPVMPAEDMIRCAVTMAGAADLFRTDQRPLAVAQAARRLISTAVSVLPRVHQDRPLVGEDIASRLASALLDEVSPGAVRAVNAALILLADHELASSAVAVRLAASARADVYNAVLAGLGVLAGPLHRGELAYQMLVACERDGPERAIADFLRWHGRLPGFDSPVYAKTDPRLHVLQGFFTDLASPEQVKVVEDLLCTIERHGLGYPYPTVELGLAALIWALGAPPDGGFTIFTISRIAGSVAHYLEELEEPFRRFRSRGVYVAPPQGLHSQAAS